MNAVANYWKHHDEWPEKYVPAHWPGVGEVRERRWDIANANKDTQKTIEIVTAIGMRPDGLNMQAAAVFSAWC